MSITITAKSISLVHAGEALQSWQCSSAQPCWGRRYRRMSTWFWAGSPCGNTCLCAAIAMKQHASIHLPGGREPFTCKRWENHLPAKAALMISCRKGSPNALWSRTQGKFKYNKKNKQRKKSISSQSYALVPQTNFRLTTLPQCQQSVSVVWAILWNTGSFSNRRNQGWLWSLFPRKCVCFALAKRGQNKKGLRFNEICVIGPQGLG